MDVEGVEPSSEKSSVAIVQELPPSMLTSLFIARFRSVVKLIIRTPDIGLTVYQFIDQCFENPVSVGVMPDKDIVLLSKIDELRQ